MNAVVKNILKRREGLDLGGGKIALVLYGGVMSGVVGTGATTALEELGLTNAFDYIFVYSAGLPNASYFLAGQALLSSSVYIKDLSDSKFINLFKPWKIANIDYLIHVLKDVKTLNLDKLFKSKTKIILRIRNTSLNVNEDIEINESFRDNYFDLIKASIKMPILSPGSITIGKNKYKDSPKLDNNFLDEINNYKDITDVLVVYNNLYQKIPINLPNKNVFEIIPKSASRRLETKSIVLEKSFLDMKDLVKSYFHE